MAEKYRVTPIPALAVDPSIELPGQSKGRGKYPWHTMGVVKGNPPRGDSFLVRCDDSTFRQTVNNLTGAFRHKRINYNKIFTMRRVEEGVRVWRLK